MNPSFDTSKKLNNLVNPDSQMAFSVHSMSCQVPVGNRSNRNQESFGAQLHFLLDTPRGFPLWSNAVIVPGELNSFWKLLRVRDSVTSKPPESPMDCLFRLSSADLLSAAEALWYSQGPQQARCPMLRAPSVWNNGSHLQHSLASVCLNVF